MHEQMSVASSGLQQALALFQCCTCLCQLSAHLTCWKLPFSSQGTGAATEASPASPARPSPAQQPSPLSRVSLLPHTEPNTSQWGAAASPGVECGCEAAGNMGTGRGQESVEAAAAGHLFGSRLAEIRRAMDLGAQEVRSAVGRRCLGPYAGGLLWVYSRHLGCGPAEAIPSFC